MKQGHEAHEALQTLRILDTRKLTTFEDLWAVARMYNVKAQIWSAGIPLRLIDKKVYNEIRRKAAESLWYRGGGTTDDVCKTIEQLIADGCCGLGKKTYLPRSRR